MRPFPKGHETQRLKGGLVRAPEEDDVKIRGWARSVELGLRLMFRAALSHVSAISR